MIGEMLMTSDETWVNCGGGRILFVPHGDFTGIEMSDTIVTDADGEIIGWQAPRVDEHHFPRPAPGYHWELWKADPPFNKRGLDDVRNTPVGEGWVFTIERDETT